MGTEASTKPGDQVSLTRWLPKDTALATIAVAAVRLFKDQVDGLAFKRLSQPWRKQLTGFENAAGLAKESTPWKMQTLRPSLDRIPHNYANTLVYE